ncbi:DUF982 domain-containing protein [Neorhizobium sp. P12A]|nr:DUF982 domain-containing protein [Neorhizobium sp. P12A]
MDNPKVATVKVRLPGEGAYRELTSIEDLADALMKEWPFEGSSPARYRARVKCLDAMNGLCGPEDARTAFIAACREAGIDFVS